jgi:hypothetical protein
MTRLGARGHRVIANPAELQTAPPLINMSLPHTWDHIRKIRKSVGEALEDREPALRSAAMMVTSELVENAIKYGQDVPAAPQISLVLSFDHDELRIAVSNGSTDLAGIGELERRVTEIVQAPDKATLYMTRLEELLAQPLESGKLGLYRIAFEGQFELLFNYANDVVTITATRNCR